MGALLMEEQGESREPGDVFDVDLNGHGVSLSQGVAEIV